LGRHIRRFPIIAPLLSGTDDLSYTIALLLKNSRAVYFSPAAGQVNKMPKRSELLNT
jgi:hypothetical protein